MPVPEQAGGANSPVGRSSKRQCDPAASAGVAASSDVNAPGDCATRTAEEDAADVAAELKARMDGMDVGVLSSLVQARESAANIASAFPGGDQRFASFESDSEDEDDIRRPSPSGDDAEEEVGVEVGQKGEARPLKMDDDGDPCVGILDNAEDEGPRAALARARDVYGLDLLAEMERGRLDLFARIRLANYVRRCVATGDKPEDVIQKVEKAVSAGPDEGVLADDALIMPVIQGDVLLTVLEGDEFHADDVDTVACAVHNCLDVKR